MSESINYRLYNPETEKFSKSKFSTVVEAYTEKSKFDIPLEVVNSHGERVNVKGQSRGKIPFDMIKEAKYEKYWSLEGKYEGKWEEVTAEDTHKEIAERAKEYRKNEPGVPFRIKLKREKVQEAQTPTYINYQDWVNAVKEKYNLDDLQFRKLTHIVGSPLDHVFSKTGKHLEVRDPETGAILARWYNNRGLLESMGDDIPTNRHFQKSTQIIAYAYDADYHTIEQTKRDWKNGVLKMMSRASSITDENGIPQLLVDREGNRVHPVFAGDENASEVERQLDI